MKTDCLHQTLLPGLMKLIMVLILLSFFGCGMAAKTGRMPDTGQLDSLKMNVSTKTDVMQHLGKPKNGGRVMFPHDNSPLDLWCYYYEESTMSESQRIFLFVFFDHDHYSGYMWFSSLPH
jgi:hypothetical protein